MTSNTLAIDTSGSFCSVALSTRAGDLFSVSSPGTGDHFEQLPRMVGRLCGQGLLSASDLDEIRIGVGPGSFTGLRIGMSFAKGLSWAARVPLVGYSSFAATAEIALARSPGPARVVVLSDARRDEVFVGSYRLDAELKEEIAPGIVPLSELSASPWHGGSDGAMWVSPHHGLVVLGRALEGEGDTITDCP